MLPNEITTRDRIRYKADELFMRYGIRSVSMDDIASQLGMSKKTIYQFFSDKDELVDAVVENHLSKMEKDCSLCHDNAANAIEEILMTLDYIVDECNNINPMVIYDLEKFHFRAFQKFQDHKNQYLFRIIRDNLVWGVEGGLYRADIDVDIMARFRLETMLLAFNVDSFPPAKFNFAEVTRVVLEHYLYGLVSLEGYTMILTYQENRTNKSIHDAKSK